MANWNSGHPLEVLTLDLDGETFAVESAYVREILELVSVTVVPNSQPFVAGLINVRGRVVPLADLRIKLGMEQKPSTIDTRIVVMDLDLHGESTTVGIRADKVHEVTTVSAAALQEAPRIGTRWSPDLIRCIGSRGDDFMVVLNIAQVFATGSPQSAITLGTD